LTKTNCKLTKTKNFDILFKIFHEADNYHKDMPKEHFIKLYSREYTEIYLINENQGFIYLHLTNEWGLYIKPDYQGKGLHKKAFFELVKLNPRKYYWGTIRSSNANAIIAISKLGLTVKGLVFAIDYDKIPQHSNFKSTGIN